MNELYAEAGVKVKPPIKFTLIKVLLILGIVIFLGLSLLVRNPLFAPIAALLVVLAIYFMPQLSKVEYEYIFVDGEFDFDRILGAAKRKTMLTVGLDNIEVVAAPNRRSEFDNQNVKAVKNFSNDMEKAYMIITSGEAGAMKIFFNPTDNMVDCIYHKSPSKLKR